MSLDIKKEINGATVLTLSGRLDTTTAPQLETEFDALSPDTKELVFDLKELEYVSSAGLRLILKAQKAMNAKGSMKLINVSESVMEVFDITGFSDILTFA